MARCIICKRDIDVNKHLLILSHGVEVSFYSRDCVKKYIEIEERYLKQSQPAYRISDVKSQKKLGIRIAIEQENLMNSN